MADLRRMTLQSLRALARRTLGPAADRLATREALVRALARAGAEEAPAPRGERAKRPSRAKAARAPKPAAERPRRAAPAKSPKVKGGTRARPTRPARPRPPRGAPGAGEAREAGAGTTDPAGFFVARVRGEGAVRGAPHPMLEEARPPAEVGAAPLVDEQLGELPASYGEDTLVLLPRDPTSLFAFWDQAERTLQEAFRELARPRAQLWLWARAGDAWERVRVVELALEPRGWYLHGLEPGRSYRAELRAVDEAGRERAIGPGSGEVALPPAGPSPRVDDRFVRLPWDQPLGPPLGPGHRGPELPFEARQALAELSGWGEAEGPSSWRPTSWRPTSPDGGEG